MKPSPHSLHPKTGRLWTGCLSGGRWEILAVWLGGPLAHNFGDICKSHPCVNGKSS